MPAKRKLLLQAIRKPDFKKFEELLAAGEDPSQMGEHMPVIFDAAIQEDGRFACALLRAGAKANIVNQLGESPLSYARTAEAAQALIEAGADVNGVGKLGGWPLGHAVGEGLAKVVEVLLKHGADPNLPNPDDAGTSLHAAAFNMHPRVTQVLLAHGAKVDARDENGRTPLWHAAFEKGQRSLDVARALIAAGADPNAADQEGETPLIRAALEGNAPMTKLLLDAGAKPNIKDQDGHTALVWVIRDYDSRTATPRREVVALLLAAGADPNIRVSAQTDDPIARGKTARELATASKDAKLKALFDSR
jgi:ankyrin repeat protein